MVTFEYLPEFERRAKALAKKYRSFVDDYNTFLDELERNPFGGTPLGGNIYKHRMAIASKGKGKSGGARVITYNLKQTDADKTFFLLVKKWLESRAPEDKSFMTMPPVPF